MRVLVTGGCGLVGYHAATYFKDAGHEVVVVDNFERSALLGHDASDERVFFNAKLLEAKGIPVWPHDVSLPYEQYWEGYPHFDYVIHLAGQCGVPTSISNPRRDFEINTVGTFNALEYCRDNGAALALASTNKIYPIHDTDPENPVWQRSQQSGLWEFAHPDFANGVAERHQFSGARTPYGNSKMMADLLCQEYAATYGVRTGVFRMSCIYGPNQFGFEEQGWATWFMIATLKGWPITVYGDGNQVRDMLYVQDCVRAYESFFLQTDVKSGVFNLGGGPRNTTSLNEMLETLRVLTGKKQDITYADWRPLDQKCYVSCTDRIYNKLEWRPRIGVAQGIALTLDWVEKNLDVF